MDLKTSLTAGAVVCVGAFMVLLGADIIPQRVFPPKVPSWLLIAIGLGVVLAGTSVFFRTGSPSATRMVGVSMLLMALPFFWVSFFGDSRQISGGILLLPDRFNRLVGRFMFLLGAVFWLWLGVSALRHAKYQPEEGVVEGDP